MPAVIGEGIQLLRSSRVLLGIVLVEAFWGFSMVTFESLFPIRLSELVGGIDAAAAIMGPVGSAAWFASAAGAAGVVWVSRRIGVARSAALLRIVQGLTIVAMGVLAGPVGVVVAYLGCYVAHGASNPMHTTLLHRQVEGSHRTTVLSMNSMVSQPAGSLGAIVLSALADGASVSTAMIVGGIICAIAAPLYIPAWRQERAKRALAADPADPSPRRLGGVPEPAVQVERFSDAQSFLDAAGPFLADREAEHNLLFGIAANLITDPDRPMTAPPYFAAVRRDDEVVAAALMTPPFNVVVSCIDEPDAIPALAADLDSGRFPVPGITAPVEVARAFSERWAERHGVSWSSARWPSGSIAWNVSRGQTTFRAGSGRHAGRSRPARSNGFRLPARGGRPDR